jgi:type IV pilus assembly protein PilF
MKRYLAAALLTATACLAACTSTTTSNWDRKESPADAAKYNALLGIEYMRRGELAKARDKIERALEADPDMPVAHTAAGMLYDRLGEIPKAEKHFKAAIRLQDDNPELMNHYGVFLCRQNKVDEGEKLIVKAALNPVYTTPYLAYTNAGLCMSGAGRQAEAEKYYLKALQMRPQFTRAIAQLAELKFAQRDHLQARNYLERYIKASRELLTPDPDLPAMLWLGVRVERALDNPSTADAYARRLKSEYPTAEQTRALLKSENGTG